MKKILLFSLALSLCTLSLFASNSWFGIQAFGAQKDETTTYTILGIDITEDSTATLGGLMLSGTLYPREDSAVGIGYQFGVSKLLAATNGSTEEDVEDYPLTYRGAVTGQFGIGLSDMMSLELGAGLLYERLTKANNSDSDEILVEFNTLSVLGNVNVLVNLSDSLSLVGGVNLAIPLTTQGKITGGNLSYDTEFAVKGYTLLGQIGVALTF